MTTVCCDGARFPGGELSVLPSTDLLMAGAAKMSLEGILAAGFEQLLERTARWPGLIWGPLGCSGAASGSCGEEAPPQYKSQSGTCSTPCGILRRRASMEVKCPDGIGRESSDWEVANVLASPVPPS